MPKAKNRFQRSRQVLGWLKDNWPAGRRVELIWVKEIIHDYEDENGDVVSRHQCHGQTYREDRSLVIELSLRKCRTWETTTSTLIHEYCHVVLWGPASIEHLSEHHPVTFYALQGEIENRWDHDHGDEQANEYPF